MLATSFNFMDSAYNGLFSVYGFGVGLDGFILGHSCSPCNGIIVSGLGADVKDCP